MTILHKPIARRTELDPRLGRKAAGPVTVTLYPDGSIGFRKLKCRKEFRLPLSAVYSMAMKAEARDQIRQKAQVKKLKRKRFSK